ncbi:MAG: DUF4810 domain-containing protein [Bacteroidia bacterium]|nr:DUF4810 domain-containing protein [Bacteroidia bacterium]
MRKLIFFLGAAWLLSSCTVQKPLYSWAKYETASYNYLKNSDEKSTQALIDNYKNIIEKQTGIRNVPPPGIYADYGYILLQIGKKQEGKALLIKETELYPESKIFIDRIFKMLE